MKVVFFLSDPIFRPADVCFQASDRLSYGYSRMTDVGVYIKKDETSNLEVGLAKKERGERERESSKLKNMRFYTYEQPSICKILTRKIFSAVLSLLGTN